MNTVDLTSLAQARVALTAAMAALQDAALNALASGQSEVAVARTAGVDRETVRKWAGKTRTRRGAPRSDGDIGRG